MIMRLFGPIDKRRPPFDHLPELNVENTLYMLATSLLLLLRLRDLEMRLTAKILRSNRLRDTESKGKHSVRFRGLAKARSAIIARW
jgi:hypothetical protein